MKVGVAKGNNGTAVGVTHWVPGDRCVVDILQDACSHWVNQQTLYQIGILKVYRVIVSSSWVERVNRCRLFHIVKYGLLIIEKNSIASHSCQVWIDLLEKVQVGLFQYNTKVE